MSDLIAMWARRAPDPCPTCGAVTGALCLGLPSHAALLDDGEPVHAERVEAHPAAAALRELLHAAGDLGRGHMVEDFECLCAAAVVAVAELVAHDPATRLLFFEQLARAMRGV